MRKKRKAAGRGASPAISVFMEVTARLVAPALAPFGFVEEPTLATRLPMFAVRLFGNGTRYVKLLVDLDPREGNYGNVVLGDGQRIMPEADWNSVALWTLAKAQPDIPADVSEYKLDSSSDISKVVERMCADLMAYAADFLRGELSLFQAVRAEINREREPYKIHRPAEDGPYVTEDEPESMALKARFS